MKLQLVGCSHQDSSLEVVGRLAFTAEQTRDALAQLHEAYPNCEGVLLSTCNRVELYLAAEEDEACPSRDEITRFLSAYHALDGQEL